MAKSSSVQSPGLCLRLQPRFTFKEGSDELLIIADLDIPFQP